MPYRRRFGLIRLSLAVVAVISLGLTVKVGLEPRQEPEQRGTEASTGSIPEKDWGRVRAYDGQLNFLLGPVTDTRRRYELGLGRVVFTSLAIAVADDEKGTNLVRVEGQPQSRCLYHAQGGGVNIIIAIGKCVPSWATVTGDPGLAQAKEWVRVENLVNRSRVVFLKYG